MAQRLDGIKACVFDAYGTLFDFASAAKGCRDVLGDDVDRLTGLWRDKQLQYTWLRAAGGNRVPVVERMGRLRGVGLRHEGGLVQPLSPAPRAVARRAGRRDHV